MYKKSLFIFRRDLRIEDNTALNEALKSSEKVFLCFLLNPKQISTENEFRSLNAMQFMKEALLDLNEQCTDKLNIMYGEIEQIAKTCAEEKIEAIFFNKDYTPFSLNRDQEIEKFCKQNNLGFHSFDDLMLNKPDSVLTGQNKPFSVYTAYYNACREVEVQKTKNSFDSNKIAAKNNSLCVSKNKFDEIFSYKNDHLYVHGTRDELYKLIKNLKNLTNYKLDRDYPYIEKTTHLSAYLKFGLISPRQLYWELYEIDPASTIIRQLYWRDFYIQVAYHKPQVYKGPFHEKYQDLKWSYSQKDFDKWCKSETGYPIVDAGMRQLNTTGYMHNRVRMIVASFLVKDLHLNWQWGEKYFATKLVDYDPAVNNGNWQWSSSTGCDSAPYFRIFNPLLQQQKFDEECKYIKKWVPELQNYSADAIHKYETLIYDNYPKPMVVHKVQTEITKNLFKECGN